MSRLIILLFIEECFNGGLAPLTQCQKKEPASRLLMNSIQYMTTFCVYIFIPFSQSSYLMAAVYSLNLVNDDKRDGKEIGSGLLGAIEFFASFWPMII